MIMTFKQRKIKFKPRIKLNHNIYTILCTAPSRILLKTGRTEIGLQFAGFVLESDLCTCVTVACFHSCGIRLSARDLFMSEIN